MGESRAYRLKEDEPLPEGIARVARGRIDHAIDELRGKTDSTPVEAVHEARKDMKKLRALLRLARGELGDRPPPARMPASATPPGSWPGSATPTSCSRRSTG